jgi:type IV pilus assembly protein PilB
VIAEPQNLQVIDELRFSVGMEVIPHFGFRDEIESAIEKFYGGKTGAGDKAAERDNASLVSGNAPLEFVSASSLRRNVDAAHEIQTDLLQQATPAVRLVASIITTAAKKSASDIHIEPQASDTVVRFRIDGMLRDYQRIPRSMQGSVVSRIKILCDMDIADRRGPQNGRFLVKIAGRSLDLRVSTLPTQYGEKIVMHLLEADLVLQEANSLGFCVPVAEKFRQMLGQPQGLILVTGPTGSGKSTTVYFALNQLRKPSINIVTVEDPVKFVIPGVNQVQVKGKAGLTFASAVRSALKQDPNVILIDEIRDKETAEAAVTAAQTGRLVLSTLHTNDSISAVARLLDLGVPAADIAASLTGVVAQRLVRRLCACHKLAPANAEFVSRLKGAGIDDPPVMESAPAGCEICDLTGYKGRIGVYELLEVNDTMRAAIRAGSRSEILRMLAQHDGMKRMQEYALDRVSEGLTTVEEVLRVVPFESVDTTHCHSCSSEVSPAFLYCPFCGTQLHEPSTPKTGKRSLAGQGASRA